MVSNWLILGPVRVRVGSKHLAPWGYPRIEVGGLSLWSRWNTGERLLASYHPRSSITWLWQLSLHRRRNPVKAYRHNCGGWRHVYLPFGWTLDLLWQKRMPRKW